MGSPDEKLEEYRSLIDGHPGGVWSVDREFRLRLFNREVADRFRSWGVEAREGLDMMAAFPPQVAAKWKVRYERAFAGERFDDEEQTPGDGPEEREHFQIHVAPVWREGEIVGASVASYDVGERKRQQRALDTYTNRFQQILELTAELSGEVRDLEALYARILDYLSRTIDLVSASIQLLEEEGLRIVAIRGFVDEQQVRGLRFPLREPFPNARVVLRQESLALDDIRSVHPHFKEEAHRFESGHIRSWLGVPMIVGEKVVGVLTVDRAKVEPFTREEVQLVSTFAAHVAAAINNARLYQDLARSAEMREYLLRELHHRVKNNMQLVSSILSLQGRTLEDSRAREVLRELQLRVRSLGLVHEALHEATEVGAIDLGNYLRSVVMSILTEYSYERQIQARFDTEAVSVGVDISVPLGLIIGEISLNAVKHAFAPGTPGTITCGLSRRDREVELTVSDDGVGLDGPVNLEEPTSFGLRLITALSEQLGGTVTVDGKEGTTWTIRFELRRG